MMKKVLIGCLLLLPGVLLADTGDINLSSNFQENSGRPLDARIVAADATARNAIPTVNRYDGLLVYQRSDSHMWQLQGGTSTWVDVTASTTSGNFISNQNSLQPGATFYVSSGTITNANTTVLTIGTGAGAGQMAFREGAQSTVADVGTGAFVMWADSSDHTGKFNPGNTSTMTFVGSSGTIVAGNYPAFSSQYGLVDSGISVGGGGGHGSGTIGVNPQFQIPYMALLSSNVVTSSPNFTNDGLTVAISSVNRTDFTNISTFAVTAAYIDFSQSTQTVTNLTVTGTCTGCNGVATNSTSSGTVIASPQYQVPFYSVSGSSNVIASSSNFTNNGSTVIISGVNSTIYTNVSTVAASGVFYDYTSSSMTVSSATVSGQLSMGSPLLMGLGSTAGLNSYRTLYQDVGTIKAENGFSNGSSVGFYWQAYGDETLMHLELGTDGLGSHKGELVLPYGIQIGSVTGAGLTTCGDSTHALAWSSTDNRFACQALSGGSGGMTPGSTNYIQNTSALQSGATFYVSSGTISSQLSVTGTSLFYTAPHLIASALALYPVTNGLNSVSVSAAGSQQMGLIAANGTGINTGGQASLSGLLDLWVEEGSSSDGTINRGRFAVIGSSQDASVAYSGFRSTFPIITSTLWTLPKADGTSGQAMITDGATHLSFSTIASGSSGYALQPATVAVQAAQGITISSAIYISTPTAVITTTTTLTSTMSVVEAACTAPNNLITLTLPPIVSNPGMNTFIYKVNATTCQVRIQASGTDTIVGTGTMHLDGFIQHASLHATGAGWGGGVGGIEFTPERLYISPYQQARNFVVAASSTEVICPLIVPVPVLVTGYTYDGVTAGGANITIGLMDQIGNVINSTGPVALSASLVALTQTPYALPAGTYNLVVQLTNTTGKITGSDSSNSGMAGCSRVAESSVGVFSTVLPGSAPGSTPGISVLVAGGRQTYL